MARFNTVRLAIYGMPGVELEYTAENPLPEPIKPGMSLHIASTGKVIANPSALATDFPNGKLIAVQSDAFGKGVSEDWNETANDYVADDIVMTQQVRPGDKIWGWLPPGEIAVVGAPLLMTGGALGYPGTLEVYKAGDEARYAHILGHSEELVDNTAGVDPIRIIAVAW